MSSIIIVLLAVVVMVLAFLLIGRNRNRPADPELIDMKNRMADLQIKLVEYQKQDSEIQHKNFIESQRLLSDQLTRLQTQLGEELSRNRESIHTQLHNANTVIGDVQQKLGVLEKTTSNIENIGKDISSLQEILQAPKLRGNLGEYLLEDLLKQILPADNFEMQHNFMNGTQVDAVIKLGEKLVPVDSKFPLESFTRFVTLEDEAAKKQARKEFVKSLKNRIDEIASKYILPQEGTFDFALMYIPAENVFYEVMLKDTLSDNNFEIFQYAIKNHVIAVSPNSFYAYLMAIVFGLRGFQIEKKAQQIRTDLSQIQASFAHFYEDLQRTGKHISNAASSFNSVLKRADKFHDRVGQVTGIQKELPETNGESDLS